MNEGLFIIYNRCSYYLLLFTFFVLRAVSVATSTG